MNIEEYGLINNWRGLSSEEIEAMDQACKKEAREVGICAAGFGLGALIFGILGFLVGSGCEARRYEPVKSKLQVERVFEQYNRNGVLDKRELSNYLRDNRSIQKEE